MMLAMAELITKQMQISQDGTQKFLLQLADGHLIETVLMRHPYGNSVCVTSQAGCSMGCAFCASGLLKKVRNLSAREMLLQVQTAQEALQNDCPASVEAAPPCITHAVVMGTGEPFDNYEEVLSFCDVLSDFSKERSASFSVPPVAPRHITVSTCGIIPQIYAFAETEKRYQLAISLHAATNELRSRLMPINRKYPLEELLQAAAFYCTATKKRITFEYLLLKGVNDTKKDALTLAHLLSEYAINADSFYVNLIPFNPVSELGLLGSSKEQALAFYDTLMQCGIKATLRKERGSDITAACGQLRLRKTGEDALIS